MIKIKINKKITVDVYTFLRGGKKIRNIQRSTRQLTISTKKMLDKSLSRWDDN